MNAGTIDGDIDGGQPSPSLYYLRTFHAVATERSFTRGGRTLGLSQPAVSAHIRVLERYFGGPMFQIRHRRVYLTAEGEALFTYTERVFNLLDEAGRAVSATRRAERGLLRLGASATIGVYLLPGLLRQFTHDHQHVEVDVAIGTSAEIIGRVLAEDVPFGIVEAPVRHRDLDIQPVGQDHMVLAAPPGYSLAEHEPIEPLQLAELPILRREAGSATQALVDAELQRVGLNPPTVMVLGSAEALKQAVMCGIGIAWVPHMLVARELRNGDLAEIPVVGLSIARTRSVVRPLGARLAPTAEVFLDLLRESTVR